MLLNNYLCARNNNTSRVLSEPVTWSLVSSKGLLSEFLVATVLDCIDLKSVRVAVDIMVLGEEIRHWIHSGDDSKSHAKNDLGVWHLGSSNEHKIL